MIPRVGKTKIEALNAGPNKKYLYNRIKDRVESWEKFPGIDPLTGQDYVWTLLDADPAIVFHDRFYTIDVVTFEEDKVLCDHPWGRNGNRADNAGVPNTYNFAPAGRQGGGLWIQSGDTTDDWVALHTGDNWPIYFDASPKMKVVGTVWIPNEEIILRIGMFGWTNLESGNARPWTIPEDGLWVEYLKYGAIGPVMKFITSIAGVQTATEIPDVSDENFQFNIEVSDEVTETRLVSNGRLVATHSTPWVPLGFGPMKPLFMVQTNENVDKNLELYNVKLIEDELEIL